MDDYDYLNQDSEYDMNQLEEYESYNTCNSSGMSREDKIELYKLQKAEEKRLNALNNRRKHGSKYKVYMKITVQSLSLLFGVSQRTISRWIQKGKLNPRSLKDIIDKYNDRSKLDYRKRQ